MSQTVTGQPQTYYEVSQLRTIYESGGPGAKVALELLSRGWTNNQVPISVLGTEQIKAIEAGLAAGSK